MKRFYWFSLLLTALCATTSCRNATEKAIDAFTGRAIELPQGLEYRSLADSLCPLPQNSLKLVVYINSECSRCAAQLPKWAEREREFKDAGDVAVLYYVRAMDFKHALWLLGHYGFSAPVFIDPASDILQRNGIPESFSPLHTFLLDGRGRVVLSGSPLDNPFLAERYRRAIRDLSPAGKHGDRGESRP